MLVWLDGCLIIEGHVFLGYYCVAWVQFNYLMYQEIYTSTFRGYKKWLRKTCSDVFHVFTEDCNYLSHSQICANEEFEQGFLLNVEKKKKKKLNL